MHLAVLPLLLFAAPSVPAFDKLVVDAEAGPSYVLQNDNRYGAEGTRYTAREVGQQRNLFVGKRLSAEAAFGRHTAILLYAPLDLTTRATLQSDLQFKDVRFAAGEVVDHRYLFDGYRGSYLFRVLDSGSLRLDLGASLQIRNASVELRSVDAAASRFAVENDIGTVFAFKARLLYRPSARMWAMLEADALSTFGVFDSFSGGLYDVALTAGTPIRPWADAFVRLRLLGGGAEVRPRNIDNWANLFFVTAGLRVDLQAPFAAP